MDQNAKMMSWPLLKHTTDTTFYFFANHNNVCSTLSNYILSCFKGTQEKEQQQSVPTVNNNTTTPMDERNRRNHRDNPNINNPNHRNSQNHYRRPPPVPNSNPEDDGNNQQVQMVSQGTRMEVVTNQPRPGGARIHISSQNNPVELGLGLTTYPGGVVGGGGGGQRVVTVTGAGNSRAQPSRQPQPQGEVESGMGNQGIRQHVETSTKTGVFHLSKAKLHEFPPELAKIVNNLRNIDLSENKITLIPQNISAFVNLKHLNMSFNQIEVIPDQLGQLSKLETLSLSNNRIKSVPSTVAHLQKLRDVNLSCNQLTAFPVVFSSLKYLTVLDLSRNRIPEVPDGVGGLQVVELILNQNQVRQVSKDLANCPNLKTLRLQENTLELGGLPKEILSDSPVSLLSLEGNLFDVKQLQDVEGYEKYMDRYTSTKKKLT